MRANTSRARSFRITAFALGAERSARVGHRASGIRGHTISSAVQTVKEDHQGRHACAERGLYKTHEFASSTLVARLDAYELTNSVGSTKVRGSGMVHT